MSRSRWVRHPECVTQRAAPTVHHAECVVTVNVAQSVREGRGHVCVCEVCVWRVMGVPLCVCMSVCAVCACACELFFSPLCLSLPLSVYLSVYLSLSLALSLSVSLCLSLSLPRSLSVCLSLSVSLSLSLSLSLSIPCASSPSPPLSTSLPRRSHHQYADRVSLRSPGCFITKAMTPRSAPRYSAPSAGGARRMRPASRPAAASRAASRDSRSWCSCPSHNLCHVSIRRE